VGSDFDQTFCSDNHPRQVYVSFEQQCAQIVRSSLVVDRHDFRQVSRDLVRKLLNVSSGSKRDNSESRIA
jgi:hypothetical protein